MKVIRLVSKGQILWLYHKGVEVLWFKVLCAQVALTEDADCIAIKVT